MNEVFKDLSLKNDERTMQLRNLMTTCHNNNNYIKYVKYII